MERHYTAAWCSHKFPFFLLATLALYTRQGAHFKRAACLGWAITTIKRRNGTLVCFGEEKVTQLRKCSVDENFHRSDKRWEQKHNYGTFHRCILPHGANELDGERGRGEGEGDMWVGMCVVCSLLNPTCVHPINLAWLTHAHYPRATAALLKSHTFLNLQGSCFHLPMSISFSLSVSIRLTPTRIHFKHNVTCLCGKPYQKYSAHRLL